MSADTPRVLSANARTTFTSTGTSAPFVWAGDDTRTQVAPRRPALPWSHDNIYGALAAAVANTPKNEAEKMSSKTPSCRMVQIFVVDPDENLPVEARLLYADAAPRMTDATDEELHFDLGLPELLAKHNEVRERTPLREQEGERERFMKPARIRDLVIAVTTLAAFHAASGAGGGA